MTSAVIAAALGVHNVGEGLAISASLIEAELAMAYLFTAGFAIHNATEGFAVMAPLLRSRPDRRTLAKVILALPALAGLPTLLGVAVYYLGGLGKIWISFLNTVAAASIVFAMIKVNLSAASDLGGFNRWFWAALFAGTSFTYTLESVIVLAMG
jgi:ZIP family zinc transporter